MDANDHKLSLGVNKKENKIYQLTLESLNEFYGSKVSITHIDHRQ